MAFNGSEGEFISLSEASEMTARYREANPNAVKAHYIGKELIQEILDQQGCVGIRIYYGLDDNNRLQPIIVGVGSDEDDLYEGKIADRMYPCPSFCGRSNPLNS